MTTPSTRSSAPKLTVMRTYSLPSAANQGKLDRVAAVLPEYQATVRSMQAWQYRRLLDGDTLWNRADMKHVDSNLSERFKRSALNHAVAGLKSWQTLMQDEFRTLVTRSTLPVEVKRDLYRVNVRQAWYHPRLHLPVIVVDETTGRETQTGETQPVPPATLKLARQLVKHVKRHRVSVPNLSRSRTMLLDGPVAQFEPSRSDTFSHWVRISTLTKNEPVWIPLDSYPHAAQSIGRWAALTQVRVDRDGSVTFKQVKKSAPTPLLEHANADDDPSVLGLDFGMRTLFASTAGDLVGRTLYPWLVEVDAQLTQLTANLQRQGIKPTTSKRYRRFQQRIRDHVTNEVNRCLNRLVELHNPSEIVVERLDFRYGGLSKRLNRILTRLGRTTIATKLKTLTETRGIRVTLVPAAHSSRECAGCGYVDKANRKTQHVFMCGFCGRHCNADANASQVVKSRRSWPVETRWHSRATLLERLDAAFEQCWGVHPSVIRMRRRLVSSESNPRPTADGLNVHYHAPRVV